MPLSHEEVIRLLDDYIHGLLDDDTAAEFERSCDQSPALQAALDAARRRLRTYRAEAPNEAPEPLIRATLDRIQRNITDQRRRTRRVLIGLGGVLAASILAVIGVQVAAALVSTTPVNMAVLGQKELLAATMASLRIRLTDHAAGQKPLANVPVTIELKDRSGQQSVQLASLTTDSLGGVEPRFTVPDWKDGDYTLTVTAKTPRGTEVMQRPVRLKRSWQIMLSSDKPVYQPGQTIHVRSLALRRPDLKPIS
jgi:hypothetical protein